MRNWTRRRSPPCGSSPASPRSSRDNKPPNPNARHANQTALSGGRIKTTRPCRSRARSLCKAARSSRESSNSVTPAQPRALIEAVRAYAATHTNNRVPIGRADFSSEPPADPDEERNVVRDAGGHPTGLLLEAAQEVANRAVPRTLSPEEKPALLHDAALPHSVWDYESSECHRQSRGDRPIREAARSGRAYRPHAHGHRRRRGAAPSDVSATQRTRHRADAISR